MGVDATKTKDMICKPNGRLGSRKTRTGCVTCKQRKVKCDEGKPTCKNCSGRGLPCGGYANVFVTTSTDEWAQSPGSTKPLGMIAPQRALAAFKANDGERRAFDFYRYHVSSILGGALDSNFWTVILPRISQSESAVRHAIMAVGASYEHLNFPDSDGSQNARQLCISSYNKALSATSKRITEPGSDMVALSTCILFLCMEFLQGNNERAMELLHKGAALVRDCIKNHSARPDTSHAAPTGDAIIDNMVIPLFERLIVLSALFGDSVKSIHAGPKHAHQSDEDQSSATFDSISSARDDLYRIMADAHTIIKKMEVLRLGLDVEPDLSECLYVEKNMQLAELNSWLCRFENCVESMRPLFGKDKQTEAHLRIYHAISVIWMDSELERTEDSTDVVMERFQLIVDESRILLESLMCSSPAQYPHNRCIFEMGVIPPLYFCCTKCRDPVLRRKALALLALAPRKEGLWNRDEAVRVARRVIEIEEGGLQNSSELSLNPVMSVFSPRVVDVKMQTIGDGPAIRAYFYARMDGDCSPLQIWEEILS